MQHGIHKPRGTFAKVRRLNQLDCRRDGGMVRHFGEEHLEKSKFNHRADFKRRRLLHERLQKILQVQMPTAHAQGKFHRKWRKSAFLDKGTILLPKQKDAVSVHAFFQRFI